MVGTTMPVEPNLYHIVRDCAISHGPEAYWQYTYQKYSQGGSQKIAYMMSLATTKNERLISQLVTNLF